MVKFRECAAEPVKIQTVNSVLYKSHLRQGAKMKKKKKRKKKLCHIPEDIYIVCMVFRLAVAVMFIFGKFSQNICCVTMR